MMDGRAILCLVAVAALAPAPGCGGDSTSRPDGEEVLDGRDAEDDGTTDVVPDADEATEAADDGGGGGGTCTNPLPLACDDSLSDETTIGAALGLDVYSCAATLDESGPDRVYSFEPTEPRLVTITMVPPADIDLDLFVLGGACDADSCAEVSARDAGVTETVAFLAEPGTRYYVVVDGYAGAEGDFSLAAACAVPEECDNDADDNDNGLVDCEDSMCWSDPACAEVCDNDLDDDLDGFVDCIDPDCAEETGCIETICDDTIDNDGDTLVDCDDSNCSSGADRAANCWESDCDDTVDNDGDTLVDCDEFDCIGDTSCAGGTGVVGDACATNADCASGACFDERGAGWAGGYCLVYSTTEDCSTLTCPAGSTCVAFGSFGPFACLEDCAAAADCRPGHECQDVTGDDVPDSCVGGCTSETQCTVTGFCTGSASDPGICRTPPEDCGNTTDDDGDTVADCADGDCLYEASCGAAVSALAGGDTCEEAAAIAMPSGERGVVAVTGTLAEADGNDHTPSCVASDSADVVYSFTLSGAASATVDLLGGPVAPALPDTVLSLARGCGEPDLQCNDDFGRDFHHSRVGGLLGAGTYFVFVDGYRGATGDYSLGFVFADP